MYRIWLFAFKKIFFFFNNGENVCGACLTQYVSFDENIIVLKVQSGEGERRGGGSVLRN